MLYSRDRLCGKSKVTFALCQNELFWLVWDLNFMTRYRGSTGEARPPTLMTRYRESTGDARPPTLGLLAAAQYFIYFRYNADYRFKNLKNLK